MAAPQASSRLELLQARFQQKQLQEKEQKLLQLYDQQQQRAYQVVQRGSAGSNGSSYGSSVSQHTVTKTSSNSHTTSTSQGGKVRQMFDERRQTTVKGIDRSYPLEPLENKPRKQTNGNVQKNGNSSVNRHSVTVKRVARADVNSNLNAGKPIVSYHEEITRESFGPPSGRQHPDDDEFGNENHVSQYANGNHRDEIQIEEVLDEDTIERNRMMAKLHLMEYDETLKHRIKNDLESEEFPENFMVDVPDKLPKQSLSKKLSQAEARLERFRNANAKRISNATKNTSSSQVPKKRAETGLPGKSSFSKGKTRNASERLEEMLSSSDSERTARRRDYYEESERSGTYRIDSKGQFTRLSSESSRNGRFRRRSPTFFCKEPEESATTCAIDSKTRVGAKAPRRLSPDFSSDRSRSGSPRFFCKESERSATTYAIDPKTTRRLSDLSSDRSRSGSPRFFGRESEKSATTYAIDSKAMARSSPDFSKDVRSRSESPKFFCKESEKSATTYAIDSRPGSKTTARSSPDYLKDRRSRSGSPKFFCKESEKSATTYAIDSRPGLGSKTTARSSPDYLKDRISRSGSPRFFGKESEKSATTYAIDSKAMTRSSPDYLKDVKSRSGSPKFFCKESEKLATTYAIDSRPGAKTTARSSPDYLKDRRSRSGSPRFFGKESEKSAATYTIDSKAMARSSPDYLKDRRSRSGSPKFFCKESEKSATTYAIDAKTGLGSKTSRRLSPDFSSDRSQSGSPRFFCKESEKSATTYAIDPKLGLGLKASERSSPDFSKDRRSQSGSPKFFCKESDKSATTYAIDSKSKKKLTSDLSKNRFVVKIEPDSELINKNSRKSPVTTDDTVDKYIKDHNLDRVRTPSPTGSLTNYTSRVKINDEMDSKSTRTVSTNIFDTLTRDRGSSPQFLHQGSRKSPISVTSTKRRDFVSKSPDKVHNVLRDHAKMSPRKHDVSRPRATSKSPDFTKTLRKSNASPQYFSDRSATIMFVTPETITKTKAGYSKPAKKARSPTLLISKVEVANGMIDSRRRKSVENIDESSKQRIRSSVSRYFEQYGTAARSEEARARDSVQKSRGAGNVDVCRVSSPVSLKHMEPVSPVNKSPQLYREAPGKFIATSVDRSRSGTPEFFCYETDKMATTVSLKPRPGTSPEHVRSESRLSKSSDVYATIKNVDDSSRSSSPSGTRYMTDKDKRILRIFPSNNEQPKCLRHTKSPLSTNKFTLPKAKSSKNFDVFNINKDRKPASRRSTPSGSPEFFCYETDKMATTVSLKPRPSEDARSPEPSRPGSRLSKSPEISIKNINTSRSSSPVLSQYLTDSRASPGLFSSKNDRPGSSKGLLRKHTKSPLSTSTFPKLSKNSDVFKTNKDRKPVSRKSTPSGSPEFFCYETDKMATTVSLKPRPSEDSRSPEPSRPGSRLSKSPEISIKNINTSRSSSPVLSQYLTDSRASPGLFSSKNDRPGSSKGLLRNHTKSPLSTSTFPKLSKNSDVFKTNKDRKPVSRKSTPSGSPEFFCYETDKMATTVSLKPRPSEDARSPEPSRPGSRLSKSPEISIKNINTSRSSSPVLSQYLTDSRASPGLFSSKNDRPGSSKGLLRKHTKSPLSTSTFPKLSKNSDVFKTNKDRKPVSRSTPSGSPEFFCYETDKMATTVSLKPRPSEDSRSPEPSRPGSRLSKSPEISIKNINTSRSSSPVLSQYFTDSRASPGLFSSKNDGPNSPKDLSRKHSKSSSPSTYSKGKSPKNSHVFDLPKDTKSNSRSHSSRSPDFCCYETEKSVSLRASSKTSRSSGHADTLSKGGSSKSPEQSARDPKGRRGSGNVLRSTKLIRDIIKHQGNRENAYASWRDSGVSDRKERTSSVGDVGLKQRSKVGSSRSIVDRPTTPTTSSRRKLPDESSPKSGTSVEMISEIQAMSDQYAKPDRFQSRGTYSKSWKACSSSRRSDTFTSSLTKQARNRRPPLDSAIFSSSKRDRSLVESRREMDSCSEKTTRSCNNNESVFKRRTMEDSADLASLSDSSLSEVQTASLYRQPPTLGSIELVRKVMESGTRAPGKTLETQEADEQEGTQKRPSNSVSGAAAVNDGRSSSTNYERTDSVESALRRFDSIDTEAGVESVRVTLQESVTEKRQTPEESRVESSANDSSTISLKALDQDVISSEAEQSATRSKRTSGTPVTSKASKKEEERRRKKITKITDPSEITGRVRPLTCRRRLFQDNDVEARSLRKIGARSETTGPAKSDSKKANRPSTGASDSDLSLSVKRLRSIEGIRKSFGDISSDREAARAKAAIAGSASRDRSGRPRVSSSVACDRIGKESLAKRSENVGASRDSERFVKSATRFSRVQKSPSLDSTKVVETNSRTRRSVLSPSKSPDMVTRRPSTELKASDVRSTKRTTPTKDAEPIGSRKTTTTTTTTRKSTDAVDGATILENGLHLQDQTVETKYDNEPQTAKKTFVIDYEEQPPKENNGPLPRKPLLKKPSIEKQTPSTPMQASTSNPKSKMTMRAKTTNLTSSSSRSSASSKSGSNCTPDLLVPCKICGRSFAQDRVTLHEQICSKTGQKRRKLFDSVMSRVKGTELEKFVKKGCAKKQPEKPPEPKSNWRRKHEDFINAIRSAKQVQAHLAAGGKLSDLPPPPPSDTSDYIQCPHCGRKFNKSAAERHIPKCEHMLHNKPVHSRAPKPRR